MRAQELLITNELPIMCFLFNFIYPAFCWADWIAEMLVTAEAVKEDRLALNCLDCFRSY